MMMSPTRLVAIAFMASLAVLSASAVSVDTIYEIADLTYSRLLMHNCYETVDPEKCNELKDVSTKDVRLYFAGLLANNDTVTAVVPSSDSRIGTRPHDAFFVLDPFPAYKFGHPVFMFYLDYGINMARCENVDGTFTELSGLHDSICIQLVRTKACNERPMSSSWDCQIKFLPLVVPTLSGHQQSDNVLECMDKKDGFLMNCPKLRTDGTELPDMCNHLKTNNKGCSLGNFRCTAPKPVNQAVMIFGGWSRSMADFMTAFDLSSLMDHLVAWGFSMSDIRTFFANGINTKVDDEDDYAGGISNVEPADKLSIRRYIKSVCTATCVNTFFVYLSSPTTKEGNSLLWDANGNGLADSDEIYSHKEFLADISQCLARRVVVFADQSYSGLLSALAVSSANRVRNLMIIPTTKFDDWTPRHSFNAYMRESSRDLCLSEYLKPFQESQMMPGVFSGISLEQEMKDITISGLKPCVSR